MDNVMQTKLVSSLIPVIASDSFYGRFRTQQSSVNPVHNP